ncbi:uncharacterized protein LOC125855842 [Solanum stenotomum]|uniref:uncharacterized protein LOC125855842 n=1 Tax=Solanum stenotomum TaxID=172797 RepID=UPI0020D13E02|nr:uncharacterized protein LOC125855842 [Solanum stenotomum]
MVFDPPTTSSTAVTMIDTGALDITGYCTRMKKLWEELSTLAANHICNCRCTCGAKDIMYKVDQDMRLIQFLMGLNEDENYREIRPHNKMFTERASLAASASGIKNFKMNYTSNTNTNESSSRQGQTSQNNSYNQRNYGYNPPTINQRNTINGYNNMFNKGKRIAANAHSDKNPIKNEEPLYKNHKGTQLSKEQYDQLMNMLQHFSNSDPRSDTQTSGAENSAGIFTEEAMEISNVHDELYLLFSNYLRKGTNISESEMNLVLMKKQLCILLGQATMTKEFEALHTNNTWSLVLLPTGKKPIGCKWVFNIKHKDDGSIERFNARLVVKGYTKHPVIDYTKTFSPIVKMNTVRSLIATSVKQI